MSVDQTLRSKNFFIFRNGNIKCVLKNVNLLVKSCLNAWDIYIHVGGMRVTRMQFTYHNNLKKVKSAATN